MSEDFMHKLVQEWGGWGLVAIAIFAVLYVWFMMFDERK